MSISKPQIKIVNVETGEEIVRDATAAEIKEIENREASAAAKKAEKESKDEAKAELLERLGITEDEAKLLLA